MQSRRDQVQAQSHVLGRLVGALVAGDPDVAESPTRRLVVGNISGFLVAVLVVAGFVVYGLLRPGGATPAAGAIIVAKETGSRYVLDADRRLRPVINLASARLLLGAQAQVQTISAKSLAGLAQGEPIGIVGAPETLPAAATAATLNWTACTTAPAVQEPARPAEVSVEVSAAAPAGTPWDAATAVVAAASNGNRYLIWSGLRYRLAEPWMATVLGFDDATVVAVADSWLTLIPVGPDIRPVRPNDMGRRGPAAAGAGSRIGDVYRVTGLDQRDDRLYLLRSDGLAPLSEFAAELVLGDRRRTARGLRDKPLTMTTATVAGLPISTVPVLAAELPTVRPRPAVIGAGQRPCVRYAPGTAAPQLLAGTLPDAMRAPPRVPWLRPAPGGAQLVSVAAGGGGLVVASWPWQEPATGSYLVTDNGVRYPVGAAAAASLGYPAAVSVPPPMLDLLPVGPELDPGRLQSS